MDKRGVVGRKALRYFVLFVNFGETELAWLKDTYETLGGYLVSDVR